MFVSKIFSLLNLLNSSINNLRISSLKFGAKGSNVNLSAGGKFLFPENIYIENDVYIGPNAFLSSFGKVEIGSGSVMGPNLNVFTANHNFEEDVELAPYDKRLIIKPVSIGKGVWIGANVIILPGVSIGNGAVIGAGSVVSKDVLDFCIAVGNPAKTYRKRKNIAEVTKLISEGKYYLKFKNS